MQRRINRHAGEQGVALLFVALSLTAIMAMVGLAIDAGQLYVNKQMAQAAADAGAQAGVMDMYNGTGGDNGSASAIAYAQRNGFNTAADSVVPSWPSCADLSWCSGHVTLASGTFNLIQVTVTRNMPTTFLRVLGITVQPVTATAYAAISYAPAAIPIVVTHPHLVDALSTSGTSSLTITGGPPRAIQVNSDGTIRANGQTAGTREAFDVSGSSYIDLSHAGPHSTGADFRSWGPKASEVSAVNTSSCSGKQICLGSSGNYMQPASLITDPFAALTQPSKPAAQGTKSNTVNAGNSITWPNCPDSKFTCPTGVAGGSCQVYTPGYFDGGIDVKNNTAYFAPGLYYITNRDTNTGFNGDSNSAMYMLKSVCPSTPSDGSTGDGMVVFNAGRGAFTVGSNGIAVLEGPAITNTLYEGILFWEDRTLANGATHKFGGGGAMTLTGSIYASMQSPTYNNYQSVILQGHSGSTTEIVGEVVTNVLTLGGTGSITMSLSTSEVRDVRAVAFVQ